MPAARLVSVAGHGGATSARERGSAAPCEPCSRPSPRPPSFSPHPLPPPQLVYPCSSTRNFPAPKGPQSAQGLSHSSHTSGHGSCAHPSGNISRSHFWGASGYLWLPRMLSTLQCMDVRSDVGKGGRGLVVGEGLRKRQRSRLGDTTEACIPNSCAYVFREINGVGGGWEKGGSKGEGATVGGEGEAAPGVMARESDEGCTQGNAL